MRKPTADFKLSEVRYLFEVNYFGLVAMTDAVLPHMLEARAGKIFHVGSALGYNALPCMSHYCGAALGLFLGGGMVKRLGMELQGPPQPERSSERRVVGPRTPTPASSLSAPPPFAPTPRRTSPPSLCHAMHTATKYAVRAYADMQRVELAPFGIKVCFVAPG